MNNFNKLLSLTLLLVLHQEGSFAMKKREREEPAKILMVGARPDEPSVLSDRTSLLSLNIFFLDLFYDLPEKSKIPANCFRGDFNEESFMQNVIRNTEKEGKFDFIVIDSHICTLQVGLLEHLTKMLKPTGSLFIQNIFFKDNILESHDYDGGEKAEYCKTSEAFCDKVKTALDKHFREKKKCLAYCPYFYLKTSDKQNDEEFARERNKTRELIGEMYHDSLARHCKDKLNCTCELVTDIKIVPSIVQETIHQRRRDEGFTKDHPMYKITPMTPTPQTATAEPEVTLTPKQTALMNAIIEDDSEQASRLAKQMSKEDINFIIQSALSMGIKNKTLTTITTKK